MADKKAFSLSSLFCQEIKDSLEDSLEQEPDPNISVLFTNDNMIDQCLRLLTVATDLSSSHSPRYKNICLLPRVHNIIDRLETAHCSNTFL